MHSSPKFLHLIRHAKSSWSDPTLDDFDRPLNNRGTKACSIMAEKIVAAGCPLEYIHCSPAQRAQSTISGISQALRDRELNWHTDARLYTFSSNSLWTWFNKLERETSEHLVIVGHNPAFTEFTNQASNENLANIPTCGYVKLKLGEPIPHWSDFKPGTATLETFLYPKMF